MFIQVPDLLTSDELQKVDEYLEANEFMDGAVTADEPARSAKKNLQLEKFDGRDQLDALVLGAFARNGIVRSAALPKRVIRPVFSKYTEGMEYGWHTDNPIMSEGAPMRVDLAATLFLSEPDSYEGGALVVQTAGGQAQFKLPRGHAVIYPATTTHSVETVSNGTRLAAIVWMQSLIVDAARRELLYELDAASRMLRQKSPSAEETRLIVKCHSNLLRMWSEV